MGRLFQVLLFAFAILALTVMLVFRVVQYFDSGGGSFDEDAPTSQSAPEG
jgi:hypothetical protein